MFGYVLSRGILVAADAAIRTRAAFAKPLPVNTRPIGTRMLTLAIPKVPQASPEGYGALTLRIALQGDGKRSAIGWHPLTAIPATDESGWIMHVRVHRPEKPRE